MFAVGAGTMQCDGETRDLRRNAVAKPGSWMNPAAAASDPRAYLHISRQLESTSTRICNIDSDQNPYSRFCQDDTFALSIFDRSDQSSA